VFVKGANWIPPDPFLPRITLAKKRELLLAAKAVGINLLRVWGGGGYEDDNFYDLCDSLGILVWQDFPFACSMYPHPLDDPDWQSTLSAEATQAVSRLMHHPSLLILCGNNEVEVAWKNWGWQKSLNISPFDSAEMWSAYEAIFYQLLPSAIADALWQRLFALTFARPEILEEPEETILRKFQPLYTPTSPLSNWGKMENFNHGTMHYWGVWHGADRFDGYKKYVGRFMNEYGFQSFPDMKTIAAFVAPEEWALDSPVMRKRQKSYVGNGKMLDFLQDYYQKPADFQDFVYKSQLTQRVGMDAAIRAHRQAKGHCWGTVYWQFNDTWPCPSWSSIDYFGRWKAFHYALRELYANVLIAPEMRRSKMTVHVVSDEIRDLNGTLKIEVLTFRGRQVFSKTFPVTIPKNSSILAVEQDLKKLWFKACKQASVARIKLSFDDRPPVTTLFYFKKPKNLRLKKTEMKVEIDAVENAVRLSANTLVKDVFLSAERAEYFSDNFFDLLPGQPKTVTFKGTIPDEQALNIRFLNPK
jgi:beta-mannosidase